MPKGLTRNWWALVIRGLAAVTFGLLGRVWPGMTLEVLIFLYGVYALADGVFAVVAALAGFQLGRAWWSLFLEGLVGIAVGIIAFAWPGITALVLLYLIAFWAITTGVFEVALANRLRIYVPGEWAMVLCGVLSVLFGIALLVSPGAGALALISLIGAYAIFFGLLMMAVGLRLRGLGSSMEGLQT